MALLPLDQPWAFTFGVLGNIISFMVYLAPLPTFYRVYTKKSTEGFQSLPYVVALFSAMLWIYYALIKSNADLLITINSIGCVIETIYIIMYLTYAPKDAKILTAKILLLLNVGMFGLILLLTLVLSEGSNRVSILGWICLGFSVSVFVAPLSVIRLVVRTKSVEFMPFSLSFFLTLSAVVWFTYGLLTKDKYVALPNVLGFLFGIAQMVIYVVYKDGKPVVIQEYTLPEHIITIAKLGTLEKSLEVHPIDSKQLQLANKEITVERDRDEHDKDNDNDNDEDDDNNKEEGMETREEVEKMREV
ncbi:bidirectional sugar transporter SWEET14-like [Typha angustifolia]|uniref:bidirectional sugar transporter SWEET14-like n=1 Tax=Typha angustifolia TaxID=59011 RepID=UPI003C2CF67F